MSKPKAKSPWQPIETVPGDDELYFVRAPNVSPLVFVAYQDKETWITWSGRRLNPSHWMPIPPLPEGER